MLYMCPQTAMYMLYMCPHTGIYMLHVFSYWYIYAIYVSSYCCTGGAPPGVGNAMASAVPPFPTGTQFTCFTRTKKVQILTRSSIGIFRASAGGWCEGGRVYLLTSTKAQIVTLIFFFSEPPPPAGGPGGASMRGIYAGHPSQQHQHPLATSAAHALMHHANMMPSGAGTKISKCRY